MTLTGQAYVSAGISSNIDVVVGGPGVTVDCNRKCTNLLCVCVAKCPVVNNPCKKSCSGNYRNCLIELCGWIPSGGVSS